MRLDDFSLDDFELLKTFSLKPWILKTTSYELLEAYLPFNPMWVDLDLFSMTDWVSKLQKKFKIILSAHLDCEFALIKQTLRKMKSFSVESYKLVVSPTNNLVALKTTYFLRKIRWKSLSCFCMGHDFTYSRFFGLIDQHPFIYLGFLDNFTAKGQIAIEDIKNYQVFLSPPKILGLIGDPVEQSIGDLIYNQYFASQNIPAIYLKVRLKQEEAKKGVFWLKKLEFIGLSVTTPLKGVFDGFYNTIDLRNERFLNTDSLALKLLLNRMPIVNKKALIIGFGAVGQESAKVLIEMGFKVFIFNRTKEKIVDFQKNYPVTLYQDVREFFDIVIQTSSENFLTPMKKGFYHENANFYIEAVSKPLFTFFVKKAMIEKKTVVLGFEWFLTQGFLQMKNFFPSIDFSNFFDKMRPMAILEILKKH